MSSINPVTEPMLARMGDAIDISHNLFKTRGVNHIFVSGKAAVTQTILNFLVSLPGDYIGRPEDKGPLASFLQGGATLNPDYLEGLRGEVKKALEARFPALEVVFIDISPAPGGRAIRVQLEVADHTNRTMARLAFTARP